MANFYDFYWTEKKSDKLNDFDYKWPVLSKIIPQNQKIKILDYGCGTGKIFKELMQMNPQSTISGTDISEFALKKIEKRFPKNRFYLVSDGTKIPLKNSTFDFIAALDVIEHIVHTDLILDEFYRILAPKGKLLISTPYHGVIKNLVLSAVGFEKVFNPFGPHIRFFTEASLTEGLERHKFKILKKGHYGRFSPLWRGMYFLVQK